MHYRTKAKDGAQTRLGRRAAKRYQLSVRAVASCLVVIGPPRAVACATAPSPAGEACSRERPVRERHPRNRRCAVSAQEKTAQLRRIRLAADTSKRSARLRPVWVSTTVEDQGAVRTPRRRAPSAHVVDAAYGEVRVLPRRCGNGSKSGGTPDGCGGIKSLRSNDKRPCGTRPDPGNS